MTTALGICLALSVIAAVAALGYLLLSAHAFLTTDFEDL